MNPDLTPWRAKKLPDESFSYLVPDADIKTDGGKMTVRVVVSTETMDRERDILITKGADLANHRRNPAVLLNHRRDWPCIAKAEDAGGNYTVKAVGDRLEATHHFVQNNKLALDAFRLIESKALTGISPGFLTRPGGVHKVKAADGQPAFVYTDWELVEITHCPIGMNGENIVLAIEKGFGGEQLSPELKEMLIPFAPAKKAQVTGGWEGKVKSAAVEVDAPAPDSPIDLSDADPVPLTPSTQFYHAIREKAFDFLCMAQELAGVQELERTKADGRRVVGLIGGILDTCLKGHANHVNDYPDQPGLPDGANAEILTKKMSEWRVKALDAWEAHKRQASAAAVDTASATEVTEAVKFCQTLAADRQQRTSVRAVAKKMADRLMQVKMVSVPRDDEEEAEWGQVAAKLDTVLAFAGKE